MNARVVALIFLCASCTPGAAPVPTTPAGWLPAPALPRSLEEVAAAAIGERIFVVGGFFSGGTSDEVFSFDPRATRWRRESPLPIALNHAAAVAWRGSLMVIGGFTSRQRASARVFVLRDGRWTEAAPLRHPRGAPAAAVVGSVVVVAGGVSGTVRPSKVEVFDGAAWHDGAPMPVPRDHVAGASDGRRFYAALGRSSAGHLGAFDSYDPINDAWTVLPDVPVVRSGAGAAFFEGRIIVAGGEASRTFGEVNVFDVASGRWGRLLDLRFPRHGLGVVVAGSRLYALGGGEKPGLSPVATVEVLALSKR